MCVCVCEGKSVCVCVCVREREGDAIPEDSRRQWKINLFLEFQVFFHVLMEYVKQRTSPGDDRNSFFDDSARVI